MTEPRPKPVRRKVLSFYSAYNRQTKAVEVRWRLRGTNGGLIDSSNDGFARLSSAERNAALVLSPAGAGAVHRTPDTDAGTIDGRDDVRVEWTPKDAPVEGMPRTRAKATKSPAVKAAAATKAAKRTTKAKA